MYSVPKIIAAILDSRLQPVSHVNHLTG